MSVLDIAASPARKRSAGPAQFAPIRDQITDSETDTTYALASRVSDDEPYMIYASGVHAHIIETHNERARLTHAKSALEETDTDGRAEIDAQLGKLPKTKGSRTGPVARGLMLYAAEDDAA